jgi:twinkle protein
VILQDLDHRSIDVAQQLADRSLDNIADPDSLYDRVLERRSHIDVGIKTPWSKLDGLFCMRPGELILFGGYSGSFKSTAANAMAVSALQQGYRVGIASLEMPAEDVVESMAEIAAANRRPTPEWLKDFTQWAKDRLFIYDKVDAITPTEALQMCICMRAFLGCDLIIVDCLFMCGVADDLEAEKKFSQQLAAIAKAYKCAIVICHHMRKPSEGNGGEDRLPNRYSFIGSSHLVNVASSIVICWANKKKLWCMNAGHPVDDDEDGPDIKINVAKQRNAQYEGVIGLYIKEKARVFCPTPDRKYDAVDVREKPPLTTFDKDTQQQSAEVLSFG